MNYPEELRYSKEHVWLRVDGNEVTLGITDFAQSELGGIVFVELPAVGVEFEKDASFGVVESSKVASDVYMPVSGKIEAVNDALSDTPDLVNSDPYGEGWLVKLSGADLSQLDTLLSANEYAEQVSA